MGEDKNTPLFEEMELTKIKGYSLRARVFFAWLKRNDYRLWQVAKLVHIKKSILYSKLSNREIFTRGQLKGLIGVMGAKAAFVAIYFPSYELKQEIHLKVFGRKLKKRKRKEWREKRK